MNQQKMVAEAMNDFFDFANPNEWQQLLWLWFSGTVTGSYPKKLTRKERETIVVTYEKLNALIEKLGKMQEKG